MWDQCQTLHTILVSTRWAPLGSEFLYLLVKINFTLQHWVSICFLYMKQCMTQVSDNYANSSK